MIAMPHHRIASLLSLSLLPLFAALPGTAAAERICSLPGSGNSAMESLCPLREGMARLKIRNLWGFVDKAGQVVVEPRFEDVQDFSEGLAGARAVGEEKWGFIDKTGRWVISPAHASVEPFSGGLAAAQQNQKWGFIDRDGRWVIQPVHASAGNFFEGVAIVSDGSQASFMIDATGGVIKRFDADLSVHPYPNALGLYSVQQSVEPLLQHRDGRRLPKPDVLSYIRDAGDGLLAAEKTERRDGAEVTLQGAVDLAGRWVVPPLFRSLGLFEGGLAVAIPGDAGNRGEERFGLVGHGGAFVQPAQYASIERVPHGGYLAQRSPEGAMDFFDASGKLLGRADCEATTRASVGGAGDPKWVVFTGCGRVWAVHARGGMIELRMDHPEASSTDDHLLLIDKGEDGQASQENGSGRVVRFALFDAAGKQVLSSDDVQMQGSHAVRGDHSTVVLVQGGATGRAETALPLALLIDEYKRVRVVTRASRVLSNPEWLYQRELIEYGFAQRGEPLEGPLVMGTEQGFGAIDALGEWVVQPIYSQLGKFRLGAAFGRIHEKTLIVANDGKTIDLPDDSRRFERVARGVLEGQSSQGELVRIDLANSTEQRTRLPEGLGQDEFHQGLAAARAGEVWGLVEPQGRWVVPARFTRRIEAVLDGKTLIGWRTGRAYERDGGTDTLYGWLRPDGREVAPPVYQEIRHEAKPGVLRFRTTDHNEGAMTLDGAIFIEPLNQAIADIGNGWYAVTPRDMNGLLDARGEWVGRQLPHSWDATSARPFQRTQRAGETVLVDTRGRVSTATAPLSLAEDRPEWWWSRTEGAAGDRHTVFYGFDFKQKLRVPHRVESYQAFSEGVVSFTPRGEGALGRIGLMDTQGKVLGLYPYDNIEPMRGGFAMFILPEPSPGMAKDAQRRFQPRVGYLDRRGKVAIAPAFDAAEPFLEERAVVVAKGNLGLIDTRGQLLVHSAWLCGREPVLLDARQKVAWPVEARNRSTC